jgi:hypothetical protein
MKQIFLGLFILACSSFALLAEPASQASQSGCTLTPSVCTRAGDACSFSYTAQPGYFCPTLIIPGHCDEQLQCKKAGDTCPLPSPLRTGYPPRSGVYTWHRNGSLECVPVPPALISEISTSTQQSSGEKPLGSTIR